ncbi:hypothetical protein LTR84_007077 [Exophiala bonariae]|uniref:DUF2231 domain-containing protein n=1 Tax=Exophiala bonariae TaxID=1690606 RepID=A0AAV9MZJ5_9EURO|nr:hypothetical protein LTR84_007077 [Exophiala bonariae]
MHPHPASVHFPIAFLTLTCGLDLLDGLNADSFAVKALKSDIDITKGAYYLQVLGLITAIPAIVTGFTSTTQIALSQGVIEKQTKNLRPKFVKTFFHSLASTIAVLGNLGIWYCGRSAGKKLEPVALGIETALCVLMFIGANIGGTLVFTHGMGFSGLQRKNKPE